MWDGHGSAQGNSLQDSARALWAGTLLLPGWGIPGRKFQGKSRLFRVIHLICGAQRVRGMLGTSCVSITDGHLRVCPAQVVPSCPETAAGRSLSTQMDPGVRQLRDNFVLFSKYSLIAAWIFFFILTDVKH